MPKSFRRVIVFTGIATIIFSIYYIGISGLIWSGTSGGGLLGRFITFYNSILVLTSNPVTALIGLGHPGYQDLTSGVGAIVRHNALAVESMVNGTIATILLIRMLVAWFRKEIKVNISMLHQLSREKDFTLFISLLFGLGSVLFHMFFDHMWGSNMYKMIFFLYIGLLTAIRCSFHTQSIP